MDLVPLGNSTRFLKIFLASKTTQTFNKGCMKKSAASARKENLSLWSISRLLIIWNVYEIHAKFRFTRMQVIKEAVRCYPTAANLVSREAQEDDTIKGLKIPKVFLS